MQFSAVELESLRQSLCTRVWDGAYPTPPDAIRNFFLASYAARRRVQPPKWQHAPVSALFLREDEHQRAQRGAVLREVSARLLELGISPAAAFCLLDQDRDGNVSASDFGNTGKLGLGFPSGLALKLFDILESRAVDL